MFRTDSHQGKRKISEGEKKAKKNQNGFQNEQDEQVSSKEMKGKNPQRCHLSSGAGLLQEHGAVNLVLEKAGDCPAEGCLDEELAAWRRAQGMLC